MKRLFLLPLLFIALMSCSDDDTTTPEPVDLTLTERLINGSPFTFRNAEITTVINNQINLSNQEMLDYINTLDVPTFVFNTNGTATITLDNNEANASFDIINGNLLFTFSDNSTFTLQNFEHQGTGQEVEVFSYIEDIEYFDFSTEQGAYWEARIYFN